MMERSARYSGRERRAPLPSEPDHSFIEQMLTPPVLPASVVIDTDAYNEIDDQFAIVHALLTPTLTVEAIYAAPFHNQRRATSGPADGMEQSLREVERVLDHLAASTPAAFEGPVLPGSPAFLESRDRPIESAAVEDLINRALADRPGELAKVGAALSAARADVRDIQLRHAPYGGGGVLTISVRPGDAVALTDAIVTAGLVLAD